MEHHPTRCWWDVMGSKLTKEFVILLCLKIISDITTITPSQWYLIDVLNSDDDHIDMPNLIKMVKLTKNQYYDFNFISWRSGCCVMLKSTIPYECFEGGMGPLKLNSHTVQKYLSGGQTTKWVAEKKGNCLSDGKIALFSTPTASHAVRRVFVPRDRLAPKDPFSCASLQEPIKKR